MHDSPVSAMCIADGGRRGRAHLISSRGGGDRPGPGTDYNPSHPVYWVPSSRPGIGVMGRELSDLMLQDFCEARTSSTSSSNLAAGPLGCSYSDVVSEKF